MSDDGPVLVYYNYHSVPIPRDRIDVLVKHVAMKLITNFDMFFFCCDVRATGRDLTDYAENLECCEVVHLSLTSQTSIDDAICERMKWHATVIEGRPGIIALISGHSDAGNFGPTLTALARGGWRIALFHPPDTPNQFLDYADEVFALPIHRMGDEQPNLPMPMSIAVQSPLPPPQQVRLPEAFLKLQSPLFADYSSNRPDAITAMAQDVRQGLIRLLSRLSGAMGGVRPVGDASDVQASIAAADAIDKDRTLSSGDVPPSLAGPLPSVTQKSMPMNTTSHLYSHAHVINRLPIVNYGVPPPAYHQIITTESPFTNVEPKMNNNNTADLLSNNTNTFNCDTDNCQPMYESGGASGDDVKMMLNDAKTSPFEKNPFDGPKNPFDGANKNPFDGNKNPFDGGNKNPFDGGNKNPFDGGNKNPFDGGNKNPFDGGNKNPFEQKIGSPKNEFQKAQSSVCTKCMIDMSYDPPPGLESNGCTHTQMEAQGGGNPFAISQKSSTSRTSSVSSIASSGARDSEPQRNPFEQKNPFEALRMLKGDFPPANQQNNGPFGGFPPQKSVTPPKSSMSSNNMPGSLLARPVKPGVPMQQRNQRNPFTAGERRNPFNPSQAQQNPFAPKNDMMMSSGPGPKLLPQTPPVPPAPQQQRNGFINPKMDAWRGVNNDEKRGPRRAEEEDESRDSGWTTVPMSGGGGNHNPFAAPRDNMHREKKDGPLGNGGGGPFVERERFRKPAPQCPHWEDREHRGNSNCNLWHPHKLCVYYPACRAEAKDCGYAHPFCNDSICECPPGQKDAQLNHWVNARST